MDEGCVFLKANTNPGSFFMTRPISLGCLKREAQRKTLWKDSLWFPLLSVNLRSHKSPKDRVAIFKKKKKKSLPAVFVKYSSDIRFPAWVTFKVNSFCRFLFNKWKDSSQCCFPKVANNSENSHWETGVFEQSRTFNFQNCEGQVLLESDPQRRVKDKLTTTEEKMLSCDWCF